MKKKSVLLLSLVAFSLLGCGEVTSDDKASSSSSPISDKASGSDSSASTEPVSTGKSDSSSAGSGSESASESSSEKEEILWPDAVQDSMREHLDNRVIPYISLGISPSKINTPTWDAASSTLTIMGGTIEGDLSEAQLNDAKDVYEKASWTASVVDSTMVATNADGDLKVTLFVDDGIIYLDVTYTEIFDPDKVSSYPASLISDMDAHLGNHAADIPFVYLGTANPTGEAGNGTYIITGGVWNSDIISLATTAFTKANKSIENDENHWSFSSSSESSVSTFIASATLTDDTKLKVTITSVKFSDTSSKMITRMIISYTPPFVPTTTGNWSKDISDVFTKTFDGHAIPWFYTGCDAYLDYNSDNVATILGTTGTWNEQIFELAKAAVDKENETITVEANKWTYTNSDTASSSGAAMWTFTRTCEDGCILKFTVENYSTNENYGNKALIYVYYTKKYSAPDKSDWTDATKELINSHLDGATIPYLYLNTTSESSTWDETSSTLTITGSTFYETVFNGAASVFTSADGWTGELKTVTELVWGSEITYKIYETTKVLDADKGTKLIVTIDSTGHYKNGQSGNCVMTIKYNKPYTVPSDITDWNENITSFLKANLAGHTVPFIYLNMPFDGLTTGSSKWTGTYMIGGTWDDGIIIHASTQLSADSWSDIAIDSANARLTATKTEEDGCIIYLRLYKTNVGTARLEFSITEHFSNINTAWTDQVVSDMQNCLGGNVIPFIQLGSPNITSSPNAKKNYLNVMTSVWSDTATANAKTALDAAGWVTLMNEYDSSYTDQLNAFKLNSDGSALYLTLKNDGGAYLSIFYYSAETLASDAKSDWSDTEKAYLNTVTEGHASYVPYLYMGDGAYTTGSDDDKIVGTTLSPISVLKYYSTLKAAGYTKFGFNVSSSGTKLMAGYTDSDSNEVYLEVGYDYDDEGDKVNALTISYKSVFTIPTAEDSKWSDSITSKVTTCLGEGETLPYVYLGTMNPKAKLSSDNSKLEIYSNAWDNRIVDLAYTAFSTSTDGWTVVKDLYDNQVIASRKTTGGKIVKVVVSKHTVDGSSLESAYIEVYVK